MPLATAPLMSMDATGTLNKTLVFSKGGGVRMWVKPANPKSGGQGDARQKLAAVQSVLKIAGAVAIAAMQGVATIGYRWNSYILQQAIGSGAAAFDAALAVFTALTSEQKGTWDTSFSSVLVPEIDYADMDTPTKGGAAFVVCKALYDTGAITSPGTPGAANSAAWYTALTAAS